MRTVLFPEWIIDGSGAAPLSNHAVVIAGSVIESVVKADAVEARADDRVIKLAGMTLIPGLINNHVHLVLPGDNTPLMDVDKLSDAALAIRAVHNSQASLRSGVTTVRDVGARGAIALDLRDAQAQGLIEGARVMAGMWPITITGGHTRNFGGVADGEDALRQMVRYVVGRGADFVKVMASGGGTPGSLPQYPSYSVSELRAIVESAHALGRRVVAHCIATASIENAIDAGVDFMEHAMFMSPDQSISFDARIAAKLAKSGIYVTPTLQVYRDSLDLAAEGPERSPFQRRVDEVRECTSKLRELGVPLLAGSDAGWRVTPFDTFWKELDELVICGLTPVEAVSAATGKISRAWGYTKFGAVQPGQLADLVVVEGQLAADIRCLSRVRAVFQGGEIVRSNLAR
ncbi:MAG: amidohydrolase family protein [Chloroflexota bacterium]